MDEPRPDLVGADFERANAARIYDYFLGGGHHFAVDREQAALLLAGNPDMARACRANRSYLTRVVRWCVDQGVDQFLDLGSGVPTVGNVHEIAHTVAPHARVAYVDFEPVAVASAVELTADLPGVTVTRADLRDPAAVLAAPGVAGLLDLRRPVALLAVAVLHFVPGDELPEVLAAYRAALVGGCVQAISHGSDDQDDPAVADRMRGTNAGYRGSATETTLRSRAQLAEMMGDLEPVAPGLVDVVDWPEAGVGGAPTGVYAAVGRTR